MKLNYDANAAIQKLDAVKPTIDINQLLKVKKSTPISTFNNNNKSAGLAKISSLFKV